MSTEDSSTKWLVGCLVAGVVGMFLCGGTVVLIGLWGYTTVQQVAQEIGPQIQQQLKEQGEQMQFAGLWQPPAPDAGPNELLPESIGAWTRVGHDDLAAIPELAIARDGVHGAYESNDESINVYAYPLPFDEQGQLFGEAVNAIETAGYSTRSQANVDMGALHWMTFSFDPPRRFGRMWWAQDWLIVTMTDEPGVDLESFERIYLLAIQDPTKAGLQEAVPDEPVEAPPPRPAQAPLRVEPDEAAAPAESLPSDTAVDETAPDDPDAAPGDPEAAPGNPDANEATSDDPELTPPEIRPQG